MKFALIIAALLILALLWQVNLFLSLAHSLKNIKQTREKLAESIRYYFDCVPRRLQESNLLDTEITKQFFRLKQDWLESKSDIAISYGKYKEVRKLLTVASEGDSTLPENLHAYNSQIIILEHKLESKLYKLISLITSIKRKDSVIEA